MIRFVNLSSKAASVRVETDKHAFDKFKSSCGMNITDIDP